VLAAGPFEGLF